MPNSASAQGALRTCGVGDLEPRKPFEFQLCNSTSAGGGAAELRSCRVENGKPSLAHGFAKDLPRNQPIDAAPNPTPQVRGCAAELGSWGVELGKLAKPGNHNPSPWPAKTITVPCGKEPGFTGGEHPALLGTNGLSAGAVCPLKNNSPPSGSLYGLHTATACSRFCIGVSAAWSAVADRRCIILPGSGWFLELFCLFFKFFSWHGTGPLNPFPACQSQSIYLGYGVPTSQVPNSPTPRAPAHLGT